MTTIKKRDNKEIYREGDKLIKVFDDSFKKADVLNEALNNARVEETGLKIPKLLDVKKVDNGWAITREYIEGKSLSELMAENPDKEDEYLEKFVDLQLEIHSKKCPLLNKIKDKMHAKISASSYDATLRYDLHNRLEGMKKHTKVLHGDFCPSNVIVTDNGDYYVIDWAHATQGNASADAARTYLVFCLQNNTELAEKYLNLFCAKADIPKQLVQQWMPIVACSQSVKNIPEEKELLDSWVNVFDFQ
ncbi:MAG: phosphotransferase [Clostridiales bacterium]|nr:phosphotransferase [Clostridiales bacterium]